ncbi:hypothetical protein IWQ60_010911, partial [Tieghemiomyces parasiticus]
HYLVLIALGLALAAGPSGVAADATHRTASQLTRRQIVCTQQCSQSSRIGPQFQSSLQRRDDCVNNCVDASSDEGSGGSSQPTKAGFAIENAESIAGGDGTHITTMNIGGPTTSASSTAPSASSSTNGAMAGHGTAAAGLWGVGLAASTVFLLNHT